MSPVREKDFQDLYIGGGVPTEAPATTPVPETPTVPVDNVPVDNATPPVKGEAPVDASLNEAADLATEEVQTPVEETPPEVPAEVPGEVLATEPVPTDGQDVSGEELQKMLDALGTDTAATTEATQEIKTAAEEIKQSVSTEDTKSQTKIDDMITKIADLETTNQKNQKTIEILTSEYDRVLSEKLNLEYGTANDSKLVSMINETPELKDIISANMMVQKGTKGAKETLIQAYKAALESLTGQTFDSVIASKQANETAALSTGEDVGIETPTASKDGLYL